MGEDTSYLRGRTAKNHPVSRKKHGCHPSFVRRGAKKTHIYRVIGFNRFCCSTLPCQRNILWKFSIDILWKVIYIWSVSLSRKRLVSHFSLSDLNVKIVLNRIGVFCIQDKEDFSYEHSF